MKRLKVGIIGQGRSGRDIHGNYLIKAPEKFEIVAVVDALADRRARAEAEYGCVSYEDYRDLMRRDDLDLVVNATTSALHVPVSLDLLNHGFNVVCEKPLSRHVEEVDLLMEASQKSGKVLAVFQNSRFAPAFMQIQNVIESGVLGRIVQVSIEYNQFARRWDWQTLQENNGGNLLNTGPHPVDQALQLFGTDRMPEILCKMDRANTFGDAEDYVKLILHGAGRPLIDIEISSCCAFPHTTYNIQGTLGGLQGSTTRLEWKFYKPEEAPEQQLTRTPIVKPDGTPAYCREELQWYQESWNKPENGDKDPTVESFYSMYYNTLVHGAPLKITLQEVRQQIAVMEECHRLNPLSRLSD